MADCREFQLIKNLLMVSCFGVFGNFLVCVLVIAFEKLFAGVFEACHEGTFLWGAFASAWLWALPVLHHPQPSAEFEVLWNIQAKQIQVQIHMSIGLGGNISQLAFFLYPSAPPHLLSFPSPPVGVVEASLLLVDTYSGGSFNVGRFFFLRLPLGIDLEP